MNRGTYQMHEHMTALEKARLIRAYEAGVSVQTLRLRFGRSERTIREALDEAGVAIREHVRDRWWTGAAL